MLAVTHLPAVGFAFATPVTAALMAANAAWRVSALSLITAGATMAGLAVAARIRSVA